MGIGVWEGLLMLVIVLIIFGAGRLPQVMGDFAKGIKTFKAGMRDGEVETATPAEEPTSQREPPALTHATIKKDEARVG